MIILLTGKDSYRRKKYLNGIVGQFKDKYGSSNIRYFELTDGNISPSVEFIRGRSMFDPLGMAVMEGLDADLLAKNDIEDVSKCLKKASSDREMTVLISVDDDISSEFGLDKSDIFKSWTFDAIEGKELSAFISKEAAAKGLKLSPSDISSLASSFGGDLWAISTEIEKISLSGEAVHGDIYGGVNYFSAINALKSGRSAGERLASLELLLTKLKEDPARVFNGMAYSAPRGVDPESWFRMMADYDIAVKSGKMDYAEALVDFATK